REGDIEQIEIVECSLDALFFVVRREKRVLQIRSVANREVSRICEWPFRRLYPQIGRLPAIVIHRPCTKGNDHIPELQSFGFMNREYLHSVHFPGHLNTLLAPVDFPPFKKGAEVVSFAVAEFQY